MITYQIIKKEHVNQIDEIDRSEHIDLIYEMNKEQLIEIELDYECPNWMKTYLKRLRQDIYQNYNKAD